MPFASHSQAVVIGLNAAIVAMIDGEPHVLAVRHVVPDPAKGVRPERDGLPFGPFEPFEHRTLETGLRSWVKNQTGLDMGYVEQLYTFGDRGRHEMKPGEGPRVVSVGYLALVRAHGGATAPDAAWRDWYGYFPWEDWRAARPAAIDEAILPRLKAWAAQGGAAREARWDRARLCFGFDGLHWDEEKTLERYELLYETGLVPETWRDRLDRGEPVCAQRAAAATSEPLGCPMALDNRRILATALGRVRGKLAYRPLVFDLLPGEFTLFRLQRVVEALTGQRLHKQNFRRTLASSALVEPTGRVMSEGRGRPAELYRFRRAVLRAKPATGVALPTLRPPAEA